jgi:hypothetical protein
MEKNQDSARETWTRPELVRLGKIGDVGPGPAGTGEGASGKS